MSVIPPTAPTCPGYPACPCRVLGSVDPCQPLTEPQKSEGSCRNCVNTSPLCLRGDPRTSQSQSPHWPSVASLLYSRPFNGSLVPVASPACLGLRAAAWAPVAAGGFRLPHQLCSISRLWAFAQAVPSAFCPQRQPASHLFILPNSAPPRSPFDLLLGCHPRPGLGPLARAPEAPGLCLSRRMITGSESLPPALGCKPGDSRYQQCLEPPSTSG